MKAVKGLLAWFLSVVALGLMGLFVLVKQVWPDVAKDYVEEEAQRQIVQKWIDSPEVKKRMSEHFTVGAIGTADDEKVELRTPTPKVGQVYRETSRSVMKDGELTVKSKGGTDNARTSRSTDQECEKMILTMDGGSVTKFQTRFIKDEDTVRVKKPNIPEEVKEEIGDLAGQVVVSQKVEGKWVHTLKEGKPTEKQRLALLGLSGWDDDESTPDGKRPIGTTWELDSTQLAKSLGPGFAGVSGKAKATFSRIDKYQGDRCAVIEVVGRFKGKAAVQGKDEDTTIDFDLKQLTYMPIERRGSRKTIIEGAIKVTTTIGDQTIVEVSGKVKWEGESTVKD